MIQSFGRVAKRQPFRNIKEGKGHKMDWKVIDYYGAIEKYCLFVGRKQVTGYQIAKIFSSERSARVYAFFHKVKILEKR